MTVAETENPQARAGLRERKKLQTRDRLIEVALELCDSQGFESTTVEQIAEAADVSPRTFNRYFATKEDVILAPVDDVVSAVAAALDAQPHTGNEFEALLNAHLAMMRGECSGVSSDDLARFDMMNRVMLSSPSVGARGAEMGETKVRRLSEKVAERTGAQPGDLSVRVTVAVWLSVMHLAMDQSCMFGASTPGSGRDVRAESLQTTYDAFRDAVKNV